MTFHEQLITIGMGILGVQLFRWLPFTDFPANRPVPEYIRYLSQSITSSNVRYVGSMCYQKY